MNAISQQQSYASPEKPMRPPSSFNQEIDQDQYAPLSTPAPVRKDVLGSAVKKGPTMFMKPKLPTKKKF
jgi:hypothetical protein